MATARKKTSKPSTAQLAARKAFADMARAGAFKKRKKTAAKKAIKKNPSRSKNQDIAIAMELQRQGHPRKAKEFFERAARAKNPARKNPLHHTRIAAPSQFKVHRANSDGKPAALLGSFPTKPGAMEYAQAWMKAHNASVVIVGKGV